MNKLFVSTLSAVFTAATFSALYAKADQTPSGITVTPGIGYYNFDSDRNVDDEKLFSIGLGYQFSNPWAIELLYLNADTEAEMGGDIDVEQWRLDTLYHYNRNGNWQPYAAAGVGVMETEATNQKHDESIINLGGGVKYFMTPALSLRSDLRVINSLDNELYDIALTIGLNFVFGQTHQQTQKTKQVSASLPSKPTDADNDGIEDSQDSCPNTAPGVAVGNNGCALDDDNDGVVNRFDQCPDTSAGARVDEKGCYQMLTKTREVQLSINFANNSSIVEEQEYNDIEEVAIFMTEYPQTQVVIEGHTDDRGNADYNQQLSERRASAVAQVLVEQFAIEKHRVSSVGYGEQQPLVSNDTAQLRKQNRRVVAVVKATTKTMIHQ